MTSRHARAQAKARSLEEKLGGATGDPVDLRLFRPQETIARMLTDGLTPALVEQVEMGAEFMPRIREGKHDCILCRKPLSGILALIGCLDLPGICGELF